MSTEMIYTTDSAFSQIARAVGFSAGGGDVGRLHLTIAPQMCSESAGLVL